MVMSAQEMLGLPDKVCRRFFDRPEKSAHSDTTAGCALTLYPTLKPIL
jgi:hypothetical protein